MSLFLYENLYASGAEHTVDGSSGDAGWDKSEMM
jgi:hypothetical protein